MEKLDWTFINALTNIILVFSLVVITAWYAWEARSQTGIMLRDRKRERIIDKLSMFYPPTLNN